jgi:hypothetical protein
MNTMTMWTVIAMDGQGNVDFRDGQEFASEVIAKRVADDMNRAAVDDHDWFYMPSPSFEWRSHGGTSGDPSIASGAETKGTDMADMADMIECRLHLAMNEDGEWRVCDREDENALTMVKDDFGGEAIRSVFLSVWLEPPSTATDIEITAPDDDKTEATAAVTGTLETKGTRTWQWSWTQS